MTLRPVAVAVLLLAPPHVDVVRVASSGSHTLVVAPDGTVLCQGRNQHDVCGAGRTTAFVEALTPVAGVPKARAVAVADTWTSVVVGVDGDVYVWGQNDNGLFGGTDRGPIYQLTAPTALAGLDDVIGIAAFVRGGAALREDGTVWMWGEDREGLLGTGTLTKAWQSGKAYYAPQRVAGLDDVVQIAGGAGHVLARRNDGTVWTWGHNAGGELGLGDTEPRAVPTIVPGLAGVTHVGAVAALSWARLADGAVVAWGDAPTLDMTADTNTPVLTPTALPGLLKGATDLADGIAALPDGTVRTWGSNSFGALGTGGGVDAVTARGVLVRALSGIVQVWSGNHRRIALKSDGTLYMWGPSGSENAGVFRVPKVMTTFVLSAPVAPR